MQDLFTYHFYDMSNFMNLAGFSRFYSINQISVPPRKLSFNFYNYRTEIAKTDILKKKLKTMLW